MLWFNVKALSFNDAATLSVKEKYYRIDFRYISQEEAINLLKNTDMLI